MDKRIDISTINGFSQGVATFTRVGMNPKTGVQVWRREYTFEPSRNRLECFVPVQGKFYPCEADGDIVRGISEGSQDCMKRVEFYLANGVNTIYPDDAVKSIFDE